VRISKKTIGALLVTCRESNDVEVRCKQNTCDCATMFVLTCDMAATRR
jgi:hypothetical protein